MAKNTGHGFRRGAVRGRSQSPQPPNAGMGEARRFHGTVRRRQDDRRTVQGRPQGVVDTRRSPRSALSPDRLAGNV